MSLLEELFCWLYSYYDNNIKWKDSKTPFLSSIMVIAALFMFNFVFIRDLIIHHIYKLPASYSSFKYDELIIPTFFIFIVAYYFKYKNRYLSILKKYKLLDSKVPKYMFIFYIIVTVISTIAMGYSVRNNLFWF